MDITSARGDGFKFRSGRTARSGGQLMPTRRSGLWVVLLGPDGVGKSSVIAGIGDGAAAGLSTCEVFHLRPRIFGRQKRATENRTPHGNTARGAFVTAGKLVYLLLANWAGYLIKVRPQLKRGALVLFDRYFPDGLVDPKRYRLPHSCSWLVERLVRLLPEPDLYVVLRAPVHVLQKRKQEVAEAEAERQCQEYRRLATHLANAVEVDATRPLASVVEEVLERSIDRHLALQIVAFEMP